MKAEFQSAIEGHWLNLEPVRIGTIPKTLGTPDVYITVMDGEVPATRIDVYGNLSEQFTFSEVNIWKNWIAVGFGHRFYLISLTDKEVFTFNLGGYFGYMYIHEEYLLVASQSNLLLFTPEGTLKWTSQELGVDGIVVNEFDDKTIKGDGEWGPPGGWCSFTLKTNTGKKIETGC